MKQNPVTISSIKNVQLQVKNEQQKKVTEFCLHSLIGNRWKTLYNEENDVELLVKNEKPRNLEDLAAMQMPSLT